MMEAAEALLSAALDTSGYIVIRGLKPQSQPIQKFFSPGDFTGACVEAAHWDKNGFDTYFSTSTFKDNSSAKAANVSAVKTFKVDLDVGSDDATKYTSKKLAVQAVLEFCDTYSMPAPTMVDSGYGVHAYWIMDEALSDDDGKIYAEKFKACTQLLGLMTDPTATADVARILRIPDTHNYKNGTVRAVTLKTAVEVHSTDLLCDVVDAMYLLTGKKEITLAEPNFFNGVSLPAHLRGVTLDKTTLSLLEGKPKKFSIILRKSIAGEGCAQITDLHDHQANTMEPKWRAGLSIAHFCEDGTEAIHSISRAYAGYSEQETVTKAAATLGPYTCKTFESNWPEFCQDCQFKGKITSPIQLGDFVPRAEKGSNVVMGRNKLIDDADTPYAIPEYPFPYFRSSKGGVWRAESDDVDGEDAVQVCPLDLYMVAHLKDECDGYIVQMRLHHQQDGIVDFTIKTGDLGATDKLRECLNQQGVLAYDKEIFALRSYITRWFDTLKLKEEVAMVKTQFGWTKGMQSFVIGDKEIFAGRHCYSPAAPSLAPLTKLFSRKGDITEWRKIFNVYAAPGFEPHAFCALVGFASPLLIFTEIKGVMINAFSQDSGTGKSTTLRMANSIWGDPDALMLLPRDTVKSKFHRMGIHKNISVCMDELTDCKKEEISELVFAATQGRGNNRMSSSVNAERINNTSWEAIVLSSANTSFTEMLQVDKTGVAGQLMRLIEPEIPLTRVLTKLQADRIFAPLKDNYGVAGEEFIKHILTCIPRVKTMLSVEQESFDREGDITGPERYWSATFSCIYVAGVLAQEAGLHDIDMGAMREYMLNLLETMRNRTKYTSNAQTKSNMLGEFMNLHSMNTLTVKENSDGTCTILSEHSSHALHIRYEVNTGHVFILQSEFRKFCRDSNIHLEKYLEEQKSLGVLIDAHVQKRMGAGTATPSAPARVFVFSLTAVDD